MSGELSGRSALITGASRGIGFEMARSFLQAGIAGICICGREPASLRDAVARLAAEASGDQRVIGEVADVSDEADVTRLVETALSAFPELTILVNNAGVYGPKARIDQLEDWREWARAVEINLFGSVLMARALYAHFSGRGYGKIIQLSGGGATRPLPGLSAYAASKTAVVRFAETLAEELRSSGVDVNAIAPGAVNTSMLDEILLAGPERVGETYYRQALEQRESGGVPPGTGAALAVWLASAASDGVTGKLLAAVWDAWAELPAHRADLAGDVYTLRRIVPADRDLAWGVD
jgi:NAD(P)-dependent dehydrogenase (short-subunit alcohol dehydrogenase family)